MTKLFKHLGVVNAHRWYVCKMCFKMGIPLQGLLHDLSKYSLTELGISKYYVGNRSPHEVCREQNGYSPSWIHHYHNNKHHYQFWWDTNGDDKIIPIKMPYKYVVEMFCDRVGACMAYQKKKFTDRSPYDYFIAKGPNPNVMNIESRNLLLKLLTALKDMGMKNFIKWYNANKRRLRDGYNKDSLDYLC
jgi:hypothetical protein